MDQQELEALLAKIAPGGITHNLTFVEATEERKTRRLKPKQLDAQADEYEDVTVRVPVLTWYDAGNGQTLKVERNADGTYTKLFQGVDPKMRGEPAVKPTEDAGPKPTYQTGSDGKVYSIVATPGANGGPPTTTVYGPDGTPAPGNVVPGSVKANEPDRKVVTGSDGKQYTIVTNPTDNTTKVYDPDGKEVPGGVVPGSVKPGSGPTTDTATDALAGHPGWRVTKRQKTDGAGSSVTETVYIDPEGKEHPTPPAAQPTTATDRKPVEKHPGWFVVEAGTKDADGNIAKETYYIDPEGKRQASLPDPNAAIKGVPSYTPDLTKPGVGLIDRAKQLDELLAAGTITYEQRQAVLKNDQVLASAVANEFNVGVTLLREDYQNQTSQRNVDVQTSNTRASLANQHMQNALGLVSKFLPYMGQKPGTATNLFTGLLAAQVAHATALGGLKDIPREQMHPNLRSYAERTTAGAAGQPAAAVPNAIGAGSVPASITPGAPEPPAALPAPIFRPQPEVSLPADARNPALEGALGLARPPQPEDDSLRQQAMDRQQVALAQQVLGQGQEQPFQLAPLPEPTGMDFAPLPMVLDTSIPGLTPEIDAMAKRELDMALAGGRY